MNMFVKWTLLFILAQAALTVVQFLLRKRKVKPSVRATLITVKLLLAIAFAVLPLAGPVQLRPVQPFMIALYAVLFADAVADACYCIVCRIKKTERKFSTEKTVSVVLGILFFVYGTVNMQTVVPNYHTLSSSKLTKEHKVIFVSDVHTGSAQSFSVLEKAAGKMAAEQPDCIILGGDITDDYTSREDMERVYELFGSLDVPVYYLHGNHDRQKHAEYANGLQYTADELENAITGNGIILLKDEYVRLDDDLLLLGREDISENGSRKTADELENPDSGSYLIVADHQPFEFKQNLVTGADLQLSGHTHAGQLFPLKLMYRVIGYSYGEFSEGGATLVVSSGEAGWRVPFRTDAHCNYDVITLLPEK